MLRSACARRGPRRASTASPCRRWSRGRGAQELIVGASVDPVFGPVLLFGQGGTAVEVIADRAIALPPLNRVLARELMSRTRVAALLAGYRDRPPADLDAIARRADRAVADAGRPAASSPSSTSTRCWPTHDGVIALDARVRVEPQAGAGAERFAIRPYPAELEETVAAGTAATLLLRPIRPEDEPRSTAASPARSTPEDLRLRFFAPSRELPRSELARADADRLRARDGVHRGASHGAGPATSRCAAWCALCADPDNDRAEFAILVRSDLKGQGLGSC